MEREARLAQASVRWKKKYEGLRRDCDDLRQKMAQRDAETKPPKKPPRPLPAADTAPAQPR